MYKTYISIYKLQFSFGDLDEIAPKRPNSNPSSHPKIIRFMNEEGYIFFDSLPI